MKRDAFPRIVETELNAIKELFDFKSQAYGKQDDIFYNFRNTAIRIYGDDSHDNMLKAILVYKDKHDVAVANKGFADSEFTERLRDIIVYSLLAIAMYKDKMDFDSNYATTCDRIIPTLAIVESACNAKASY